MIVTNIIGREREISELMSLYDSGKAEFVAVYGRRRVGKNYLIDETFRGRITSCVPYRAVRPHDHKRQGESKDILVEEKISPPYMLQVNEGLCRLTLDAFLPCVLLGTCSLPFKNRSG